MAKGRLSGGGATTQGSARNCCPHHRPGHAPAAPLHEPGQRRRAHWLPPRVARPARDARRGRQRGQRCARWPGPHAQKSLSCAARLPAPAGARLLSGASRRWDTQAYAGTNRTPTPRSEPVPQTPRRVAHDAPLVAIGSGLSLPSQGQRTSDTTPNAGTSRARSPGLSPPPTRGVWLHPSGRCWATCHPARCAGWRATANCGALAGATSAPAGST